MTDLITEYEGQLLRRVRAREIRQSTYDQYTDVIRRADRTLPHGLIAACEDELRDWIYTGHRRSKSTRASYRAILTGFYEFACDQDRPIRLDYNPARKLPSVTRPRRRPRPVPDGPYADIMARAARPYRDWFLIAARAGARCIEISNLDAEHITEDETWLQGKGDENRFVPTHPELWALAQQLPPGPVAVDHDGVTRLTRQKVAHRANHHLRKNLGYPGISMHRFRHRFGTKAYAVRRNIRAVQELMGHASIATTQAYVDVAEGEMRAAVLGMG